MDNVFFDGLTRATALTRAGSLAEATALIQRTLAGASPFRETSIHRDPATDVVIEGEFSELIETTASVEAAPAAERKDDVGMRHDPKDFTRRRRRGPVEAEPRATAGTAAKQPGEWIEGVYANAAGERAYKLYVPTNHTKQALPLIVMLHGCHQTPDDFAAGTQMNVLGEEHGCLVLYPAQSGTANHSRCWNWFRSEDQIRDRGEPALIAGMTREILNFYGVDSRKVYVAGLSAGGAMAAIMGVTYPDLYAAVGIHSGLACGSAHDLPSALAAMKGTATSIGRPSQAASHSIPTIVFHGDCDHTVHPRNGFDVISTSMLREGGHGGQASIEQGQAPNGRSYTRTIHRDAAGHAVLEHWLVHGGGHAWFGGSRAGSHSDPQSPNASAEMIRFFLQTS